MSLLRPVDQWKEIIKRLDDVPADVRAEAIAKRILGDIYYYNPTRRADPHKVTEDHQQLARALAAFASLVLSGDIGVPLE